MFNLPFPHSAADVAAARSETDLKLRAERMLSLAERIGCRKFVTAPDVVEVYTNLLLSMLILSFAPNTHAYAVTLSLK